MKFMNSYRSTVLACYVANFSQAIVVNLTPIIFIPLRTQYGLTYSQFGLLVLINFITQVVTDIVFSKAVDKHGFRPFIVVAHVLCAGGLFLFALSPFLFSFNVYLGLVISTVIFSGAGGLFELLLSPIVDAIPTKEKDKAMAMLHSFYAWGQVTVVALTTLALFFNVAWWVIALFWSIIPFLNTFFFARVPLATKVSADEVMKIRSLLKSPIFLLAFCCILFGGASEVTMAQWASSFMEKGINLPKIAGDMLGMCGFAVMLGIGRVIYGLFGERLNMQKVLFYGAFMAVFCYIIVAVSPFKWLSVAACCITGICVSLLWPGTLVLASQKLPLAGASMFALLAAGGDIGASLGPSVTGALADIFSKMNVPAALNLTPEQFGLRLSILAAVLYPILSMVFIYLLCNRNPGSHKE